DLIIACTNDSKINRQVVQEATSKQLVNDTSEHQLSNFYNMATIKTENVIIGISTNGKSPKKAKQLKKRLQEQLKL
ncbi:bifunctional precorrin-2 dehydrogenase/sirohydrochlorin ferrochelatase, partial [Lactobacillus sp. XV13L]|nr:bifunctional precorrin-2 dehydrogenase/sirohydrochlorin ferrochelatase [Lactobacillus sp. XV13L]